MRIGFYLLFIFSLVSGFFIHIGCSETHQDIYRYDNVYLTSGMDDFKLSHVRKHVGDQVVYVNSEGKDFDRGPSERICSKNAVKCFFVDLEFGENVESEKLNKNLESSLSQMSSLKDKPILMVSSNYESAALLLSAYALRIKGESLSKSDEISAALGVSSESSEKFKKILNKK